MPSGSRVALRSRPAGRPRARPRPDRRAHLLQAAAAVVERNGYANTSMKDIAAEAGVAQALLHYYFESKEELLSEVVMALENEVQEDWKAAVADIEDPLRRIAVGLDAAAAKCAERPGYWRLLFDLQSVAFTNPSVRRRLNELSNHFLADVVAEIEKVSSSLPTPTPLPARELAAAIVAAVDGIALQALLREEDPRGAYQALNAMILGLAAMSYAAAGEEPPFDQLANLLPPTIPVG
ncbi:MAG: TetR/AcrR family transcriptional regulator [Candidatus Dormibacteraeota bacterium]|nr:TetR/AcrR family transcriptional regulator [Candidatus Dormibacteraeota bacterium]